MDVTVGHSLNEVEEQHITSRRVIVQQCLKENNITTCTLDEVPNIALIASGGGQRAMVGLLGSLLQLGREGLLDCMLYLSAVSGSTWCMASLYKHSNWSSQQEAVTGAIVERLGHSSSVSLEEMFAKLNKYFSQSDNYSLTHLWSALVVPKYVKEIDEHVMSAQRGQHNMDPYPIYTIIDKKIKQEQQQLQDLWFELSPGVAGYSIAGFFVDQAHFGSQFDNGSLIKKQPEMDMLYVQGMCSSCYADEVETWKDINEWLISLWNSSTYEECSCQKCEALQTLVELNIRALGEKDLSDVARKMNKLLEGQVDRKVNAAFIDPNNMLTLEKTVWRDKLKEYTLEVCEGFSSWNNSYENCNIPASWWAVITSTIACAAQWKWGTQNNFLYNMTDVEVEPSILAAETRDYMDAGLMLDSPYFSVLRPERNIDLIISLDFSEDPMESLKGAVEMSKEMGIAFPHVVIPKEASSRPEDFYVFPGDRKSPTVVHMPLFNIINCGDDLEEWKKKYTTNQEAYSPELITGLMEKAAVNVKNTKDKLLEQIERAVHEKVQKHGQR